MSTNDGLLNQIGANLTSLLHLSIRDAQHGLLIDWLNDQLLRVVQEYREQYERFYVRRESLTDAELRASSIIENLWEVRCAVTEMKDVQEVERARVLVEALTYYLCPHVREHDAEMLREMEDH